MICIAVPVCRPLYNRFLDRLTSRGTGSYQRQNGSGQSPGFALHTFGGSTLLPRGGGQKPPGEGGAGGRPAFGRQKLGSSSTYAVAIGTRQDDNRSDEEILGAGARDSEGMSGTGVNAIRITEEVKVTRSGYPEGT